MEKVNVVQNLKKDTEQNVDARRPEPYSPFEVHIAWRNIRSTKSRHALTTLWRQGFATCIRKGMYEFARISTSHFMMLRIEVSWTPLASKTMKLPGKNKTKHTRATEMFGADSKKNPSESMWVCLLSEHPAVELISVS